VRPLEAMESDIARISDLNEEFDDVDRSGGHCHVSVWYVDLINTGSLLGLRLGKGTRNADSKVAGSRWRSNKPKNNGHMSVIRGMLKINNGLVVACASGGNMVGGVIRRW
jgi:hypothetical protein